MVLRAELEDPSGSGSRDWLATTHLLSVLRTLHEVLPVWSFSLSKMMLSKYTSDRHFIVELVICIALIGITC